MTTSYREDYQAKCEEFRARVYEQDPSAETRRTDSFMRYPGPGNRTERRAMAAAARSKRT